MNTANPQKVISGNLAVRQLGNDSVYNDRRLFNRKQNIDVLKKGKDESHQHLDRETEGSSSKLSG